MPAQSVPDFRPSAARSAAVSNPVIPANVVSISQSPAFRQSALVESSESNRDGLNCVRGIRAAFLFEGGLGLLAYGIWHLVHIIR